MSKTYIDNCLYLPCLYRDGFYLRYDIYHSQLKVYLLGLIYFPEDWNEYPLGMSEREYHHLFSSCASIAQAIQIASNWLLVEDLTDQITDDEDVSFFIPEIVVVRDHDGRLVLAGQVSSTGISWLNPLDTSTDSYPFVSSDSSVDENNGSSLLAYLNELRHVDPFWLRHSVDALNKIGLI